MSSNSLSWGSGGAFLSSACPLAFLLHCMDVSTRCRAATEWPQLPAWHSQHGVGVPARTFLSLLINQLSSWAVLEAHLLTCLQHE